MGGGGEEGAREAKRGASRGQEPAPQVEFDGELGGIKLDTVFP